MDNEILLLELEQILQTLDTSYYLLAYTNFLYLNLNTYCNFNNNNISTDVIQPFYQPATQYTLNLSNNYSELINIPSISVLNYEDPRNALKNMFNTFHSNLRVRDIIDNNFNDEFSVYSLQTLVNFTIDQNIPLARKFIDLSQVKSGDVIKITQFVSTTFDQQFDFYSFNNNAPTNNIFFEIIINKTSRNWLLINKYSLNNSEKEILIKENSNLIVKNVDYKSVRINGKVKEFKIITLELCDDLDLLNPIVQVKILKYSGFNKFDNVLQSALIMKTLNYVFNEHFDKPYAEMSCRYLSADSFKTFNVINTDGSSSSKIIHKNNHSLAHAVCVACWIQLFCLQHQKYKIKTEKYYSLASDHNFIMKTVLASIFMISGRESEAGANVGKATPEQFRKDCPGLIMDPSPYERYLIASAKNFEIYVNLPIIKSLNLFSEQEIIEYKLCLVYYYYIFLIN